MEIQAKMIDGIGTMAFIGRLDGASAGTAEEKFNELAATGTKQFVIDMTELHYISSAGLRVVLVAVKKTKALQGRIVFAGISDQVREIFEMSGFLPLLETASTTADAMASLQA